MKLKKIVSLALAGILAVSMLAGCKDNSSSSNTNPPVDNTPVGYTATVYNLANSSSKSVLTAGSGSVLKAAVESVAAAVNTTEFVTSGEVTGLTTVYMVTRDDNGDETYQVITNMSRYVAGHGDWDVYGDERAETENALGLAFADNDPDETKVYVLLAPSSLSETKINADVASEVNNLAAGLAKDTATQTFSYTLGVERALIGSENEGVYVIAIQITKSSTDKA